MKGKAPEALALPLAAIVAWHPSADTPAVQ